MEDITLALQYLGLLDSLGDPQQQEQLFEPLSVFLEMPCDQPHLELQRELCKCIAEITKGESQRVKFTDSSIIEGLLRNISQFSANSSSDTLEMVIQACRALGNICYMNDAARSCIAKAQDGETILLSLLDNDTGNSNATFCKVRCGLISNYLLGEEEISKRCLEQRQLMEKLERLVNLCVSEVQSGKSLNEELLVNTLPPLSILTENVADLNFDASLNQNLATILLHSQSLELSEMCLELLHYQAENDDVKLILAKGGLCQTIFQLLEKHKAQKTDDTRAVMKLACDLIVLVLTGDEAMNHLHTTDLLENMSKWLREPDTDLVTTAVLALGNFARTDSHCEMVQQRGMAKEMLEILKKNSAATDDMKLQHALLSALRNLVIPKANKRPVVEAGLMEVILPMLLDPGHQPPVVFKLLGTLRMVVDGQEELATDLLRNEKLIAQLVEWSCMAQDVTGGAVTGESLRLMAWLVKHAFLQRFRVVGGEVDVSALKTFAAVPGAVRAMVEMLASPHLVMQNESLVALTLLGSLLRPDKESCEKLDKVLVEADLGGRLVGFMRTQNETMTKEIVDNLQTLLKVMGQSESVKEHLEAKKVEEEAKSIPVHVEYCTL